MPTTILSSPSDEENQRATFETGARENQQRADPITFRKLTSQEDLAASMRLRKETVDRKKWLGGGGAAGDEYDAAETTIHVGGFLKKELVATSRILVPTPGRLLPTEAFFDLDLGDRSFLVEVSRVVVAPKVSCAESITLCGLIGAIWQHADGRHLWLGANSASVIRTYRRLGATHQLLGPSREYHGEWRSPVKWNMLAFSAAYLALARRPAEASALRNERDAGWPLL